MNKLSFYVLALMTVITSQVYGQVSSQDGNRQIIQELCGANYQQNKQGTGVVVGDWQKDGANYCIKVRCTEKQDEDNQSTVDRKKCISEADYKRMIIGVVNGTGGIDVNGDGKVDNADDINGDGVIDGRDLEEWRRRNGGTAGGSTGGSSSGATGGATSGSNSGDIVCEYVISGTLSSNHPCAKKCRKNFWGREGLERAACRKCIEQYATENGGDLVVDWSKIPGGKPNKTSVTINGVGVRTGEIICYDSKGNIVSRVASGAACPGGSSTNPGRGAGGVSGGAGGGVGGAGGGAGGSGTVTINGNSTLQLPSYCTSGKRRDQKACDAWMRANARYACASSANPKDCMGSDYYEIQGRYDRDCPDCQARRRNGGGFFSGLAEFVAAGAPIAGAYFGYKSNQAWAGAAAAGFEQCRLAQQDYMGYLSSNELPGLTPQQQAAMNCNGYQLNGYAGLGFGGMGSWLGAGYSPGFLGGMMGPYGMYSPYGMGGVVGGAVGGIAGGYPGGIVGGIAAGYPGGMVGGMAAGYPGGIGMVNGGIGGIAAGYPGGMAAGYPGGYGVGGIAAGYPGGMAAGYPGGIGMVNGGVGGLAAGYPGGMAAGYPGGMAAGYPGGIGMVNGGVGGLAAGYPGGVCVAGYPGGCAVGGIAGGIGIAGGVGMAGGINGGVYPGYPGYPGGWGSGVGYGGGGYYGGNGNYWGAGSFGASQQASNYDAMLQQQGGMYQMGMNSGFGGAGGMGGYGAGYYPMNAGANFGGQFNAGFGMGGSYYGF